MKKRSEVVLIGASAGGMEALNTVLAPLPKKFPLPILVVQHTAAYADNYLPVYLNNNCHVTVKEAEEREKIKPGVVYIAPANYHLMLENDRTLSLSVDAKVSYARPSINVLFETASFSLGKSIIAIILTGANSDGAYGIKQVKENGGITIAQNPETAHSRPMPTAAIDTNAIDFIFSLEEISEFLRKEYCQK